MPKKKYFPASEVLFAFNSVGKETKAAVCFEIPLENLVAESHNTLKNGSIGASRNSLPKVALSNEDIQNKLANAEERWKVLIHL